MSSIIAIIGLIFLSKTAGILIFVAATVYALGKTFFWPTMLGVVAERFPKGGALTLNTIAGVGMLSVGVIGAAFLGNIQDKHIDKQLSEQHPAIYQQIVGEEKNSVFGRYNSINQDKIAQLDNAGKNIIADASSSAKKNALMTVAIFPAIMLFCYIILILYSAQRAGIKPFILSRTNNINK